MFHLLSKPAAPIVEPAPPSVDPTQDASKPVFISEQQVKFATAAAAAAPGGTTHHHWPDPRWIGAIRHIHIRLPEPRPHCPRQENAYFELGRMSRMMEHL